MSIFIMYLCNYIYMLSVNLYYVELKKRLYRLKCIITHISPNNNITIV